MIDEASEFTPELGPLGHALSALLGASIAGFVLWRRFGRVLLP